MPRTLRKMFDLLSPSERRYLYLLFLAQLFLAFVETAGIASIMPFMAVVANPDVIQNNNLLKQAYQLLAFGNARGFLFFLGSLLFCLLVFSNLFKAAVSWFTLKYDNKLNCTLSRRLLANYLCQPYVFFLNRNTADLGKNVLSEVRTVIAGVLSPGMTFLSSILICALILLMVLVIDPLVAIMIITVLGGSYTAVFSLSRRSLTIIGKKRVEANTMKYKYAGEALNGIKDLKILGKELALLEKFTSHAKKHSQYNTTAGVIAEMPRYALEITAFGGILLTVLYYLNLKEGLVQVVPILALYAFAGYRLIPALQQVFSSITNMRFNLAALDVLHNDLLAKEKDGTDAEFILLKPSKLMPLPFTQGLQIKNITFFYPGSSTPAIKNINLAIPPNNTIGFVGATGSGKTTLVDLILGLLTPSIGELLVDDIAIKGEDVIRWQKNLGYVPQHIYLSDDTVANNIAYGVHDSDIIRLDMACAARIANIADFIENELPEGYDTVIGERGIRLSGGQRQRIGIARALYRNPPVVILDEATSALDGITEEAVIEAIRNLAGRKTIIMIAHNLSTVRECDIIYQFERGRIADFGTYDQMQQSSKWFQMASRVGIAERRSGR